MQLMQFITTLWSVLPCLASVCSQVSAEGLDAMVAELNDKRAREAAFSRRRAFRLDDDVDFINSRNAHFNKKIARAFGEHTAEIKANLERGTALPDH